MCKVVLYSLNGTQVEIDLTGTGISVGLKCLEFNEHQVYRAVGCKVVLYKPQRYTCTDISHMYRYSYIGYPGGSIQPQQYT